MGLYIIALGMLCRRWWFALFMVIVFCYTAWCFFGAIDAHVKTMETYFNNLGI